MATIAEAPPFAHDEIRVGLTPRASPSASAERHRKPLQPLSPSEYDNGRNVKASSLRRSDMKMACKNVQFNEHEEVVFLKEEEPETKRNDAITPWSGKMLLTLDGGGIRGYSSLIVIRELLNEIREEECRLDAESKSSADSPLLGDSIPSSIKGSEYLPCHYFDYIGGTSTGGLIAIMLGRLRMSVNECLKEFEKLGDDVFGRPKPTVTPIPLSLLPRFSRTWPSARYHRYEAALDRLFSDPFIQKSEVLRKRRKSEELKSSSSTSPHGVGKRAKAEYHSTLGQHDSTHQCFRSNPLRCKTIVLCVQLNKGTSRPYAFRSYDHDQLSRTTSRPKSHARRRSEDDLRLHQHLSTTLVSIAQVAKAITAAPTFFKPFELKNVGYVDGSIYAKNPTLEVFHEVTNMHRKGVAAIDALVSIGTKQQDAHRSHSILSHQRALLKALNRSTEFVDKQMAELLADEHGDRYSRIEVRGEYKGKVKGRKTLVQLEKDTLKYLEESGEKERLARLAKLLVRRRKERAKTPAWESFALGVTYACQLSTCSERFEDRQTLLRHWIAEHGRDYPDPSSIAKVEEELDKSRDYDSIP